MVVLVKVVIAGVVVVIAIVIGYSIRRIYEWFRSIRQIAAQPPEVHIEAGSQGSVLLFLYRKRARSFKFLPVSGTRAVSLTITAGKCFQIVSSNPVIANNGLAVVTVNGVISVFGTLKAKAASSQPKRAYGPTYIPVHVYLPGKAPKDITITPKIDVIIGGETEEDS